jgi:hypothetical protein
MTETSLVNGIEHVTIAAKDPKGVAGWYAAHSASRSPMRAQDL